MSITLAERHRLAGQIRDLHVRRRTPPAERLSAEEYQAAIAGGRRSKFGERRTEYVSPAYGLIVGVRSRLQARLYAWLDARLAAGELFWWRWEVSVPLEATSKAGRHHRIVLDAMAGPVVGTIELWDAKAGATITRTWINKADNLRRETGLVVRLWPRDGGGLDRKARRYGSA